MQENAIYSVISPEGCAAISRATPARRRKQQRRSSRTRAHCLELGVIDGIVPEPPGGAQTDHDAAATLLGEGLKLALADVTGLDAGERRIARRERFRNIGVFTT